MGGCFPCLGSSKKEGFGVKEAGKKDSVKDSSAAQSHHESRACSDKAKIRNGADPKKELPVPKDGPTPHIAAQTFTFRELAASTKNFRPECLLGEGGFGRVYKGRLESSGQVVAVKQLDRNGLQGNREFLVEVLMLSLLHHPNLVNLIGYCADGDQRLLVYEFMPLGSLEDHLHDLPPDKEPLDWNTRMKIAAGAAKGLEYLHDKANPPVIYRDLKSSNILLDEGFHPKLSDFGLAKLGRVGDKTHVSTRVMGTYGYCAPEYAMTGQLTLKSDVYSFGVVFLELITGRKAIDNTRAPGEQNLVAWARPLFKDRRKFPKMADPLLQGRYPMRGLYQALAVAAMCLQEQAATRPLIGDVVTALTYLASQTYDPNAAITQNSRGGPSTPRNEDNQRNTRNTTDGLGSPDKLGFGGKHSSPSAHKNSPDLRKRAHGRKLLCTRMDGEGLRFFLNEHVEEHDSMCDEVYDALRYASDPSKLVLIALRGFCQHKSKLVKGFDPEVNKKSCVLLLNQLIRASTKIEPHLKKEALDFAVGIKTNLDKRKTPLKVLGYLLIIYAFGLVSSLNLSAIDLFELLEFVVHCKQTPDICRALLADKIPEFIQHLVKNNRRTEAIRYIYEFELVDKFPPVPLLTVHLQSCEKLAKDFCLGGRYSRGAKNAATRTHIAGLRALIKCIAEYNIEFEQSPAYLEKRIMQVEKEQVFIKEKKKVPIKTKNEEVPIKKKKKNKADRKRPARAFDAVLISQLQRQSGNKRLRITESADPALSTSSGTIPNKHSIQPPSQQVVGLQAGQGAQNLSTPTECNGFRGSQHVPSHLKSSPSAHGFASPTHATSKTSPAATKCESGITSSAQSNSNAIPATVQCGPHNVSTCKNQHLHVATHAHVATMTSTGIFSTIGSNSHLSPPAMQCGHVNPSVSNTNPVVQYGSGIASEVSTCQNQHHPTVEHGIASKVSTCQNQHLQTVEHAYVGGLPPQVTPDLTQLAGSCLSTMSAPTVCEPIVHAPTVCAATNTSAGFTSGVQSIQSPPQQPGGVTMPQITPYLTPSAGCYSFGGSDPATSHLNSSATGSHGLRGSKSIPMDANIVASQFGYAGNCPSNVNFGQYDVPSQNMGTPRPYAPPPYAQHVLQNGTPSPYRHPPLPTRNAQYWYPRAS